MMLAAELALAKVDVAIVERRASQDLAGSRAGGLHSRTIEVLDQRGIADRFLAEGQTAQVAGFAGVRFDISDFPTRHPYGLGLWQNHIERILAGWVDELDVPIYRGREVTGLAQDDAGVDVELADGEWFRAEYLVGCDGGRSVVRKAAGIEFPGWDPTTSSLIAEVEMTEEPELGMREDARGLHALGKVEYEIRDGEVVWKDGRVGPGHGGRGARRSHGRAHPARSQRGAHRRLRDRLRDPQPHLDLPVHRHDPAGRGLPQRTGPARRRRRPRALPRGWTGPQHRRAGCGEPGLEARPGGQDDLAGQPPGHLPRRAPPGRCPRAAQHDGASRAPPARRPHQGRGRDHCRAPQHGRADAGASPRRWPAWTFTTTSARDTRCSGAACPISTWSPPAARCGSSRCCTMPGRCSSTSASPAGSTSRHGRIACSWSTPNTAVRGSFRCSVRSPLPPPCWSGPTDMWPGSESRAEQGLADALTTWFGPPA